VLDLSALDFVTTSVVARLVSLNKRLRAIGGRLVLCELTPIVREAFHRFRLDSILEIAASEEEALVAQAERGVHLNPP
jgi:anti-sigma B factor antagonist